ncbi:GRIP1-associated protein 1-like [Sorghum bicolor]|uniref:GRIP1-associated protein 1-like n=1 Tax=Sorghum bicolor TaxID=4558 RepID=UPI000B42506F|nr:GRIP1-associated protein 1-like [Sorghum bicolor]|eukprot:XP_021317668.1 GRIP1-associated protein 1-like [Sorghum bicolor]
MTSSAMCGDHWAGHEEIAEVEEAERVERAAKRLVNEVKDAMKMSKYRKRCFDQIEGIMAKNKALTGEVDRLEEEMERIWKERDQLDQERACILESERKAGEELKARNRELTVLKANTKKHLEDPVKDRDPWKNRRWFYIKEELGIATFYDVGYVPEKRVSWTDRPEYTGQVEELMRLIDWSRLDGPGMVSHFLRRGVMPCQRRVHSAYECHGSQDSTKMHRDNLEKLEIQRRINKLFNVADNIFMRSDNRMHAYKLGQPAPKCGDHWAGHEEIAEVEEAERVERAAKRLVNEVKDAMKMSKYRKRCFDQIEGIMAKNKALTGEVDRLQLEAEKEAKEKAAQEERMLDLSRRLADKDREKRGLEEEMERIWKERDQLDQERACILESERKAGEELKARNRELTVLKANTKKHLEDPVKDRDPWKNRRWFYIKEELGIATFYDVGYVAEKRAGHEEIAEVEEAERVERAAKRLVNEVKDAMKMSKCRKRCFDQIEGIMAKNKALTGEVDRLQLEAEKEAKEKAAQEERMLDLSRRLADKDREKRGLEEEMERIWKERDQLDQERACILESERKAGEELKARNRELTVLKANTKKHLEDPVKDRDPWKNRCLQIWKGVAPVLDLISPELPKDQPRAQIQSPVEKA